MTMRIWRRGALLACITLLLVAVAAPAQAQAREVPYVWRHWDGSKVVSHPDSREDPAPITADTTELSGWYVVEGSIENSNRIKVDGVAIIILADGSSLHAVDGIDVGALDELVVYGQQEGTGTLHCDADTNYNAALGSSSDAGACGRIEVHGGKVVADTYNWGASAAGIGGGWHGDGGDVIVYGGEVTAKGGNVSYDGGAGIGGGKGGGGGHVRIYGGTVNAAGGTDGAGIGGGDDGSGGHIEVWGGDVTATGASGAGIGGGQYGAGGLIEIHGGTVKATGSNRGAGIGGGCSKDGGTINITGGDVTAAGGDNAAGIGGGEGGAGGTISISGGTIRETKGGKYGAGIGGGYNANSGSVNITGGTMSNAKGGDYGAGIGGGEYGGGGVINISGTANITATGGYEGAGIGGGYKAAGGAVTISDSTVTAKGGDYGAGIGGGYEGSGGTIKINGGSVTATGGYDAAGIGGGDHAAGGDIEIKSGTVTATGGDGGAGIGGGDATGVSTGGSSGNITIGGGEVTATGGLLGAGIGGGNKGDYDNNGTITISGGKVTAKGGDEDPEKYDPYGGAGIGGGYNQSGGAINITGGEITANAGFRSAGIGGGGYGTGGTITINGGTVKAYGGAQGEHYKYVYPEGGAGIGGGYTAGGGTITIGGDAYVESHGAEGAAGIGGGRRGPSGTITINGGTVDAGAGQHGGAGIGSGFICDASGDTVNITINGGTVKAVGGGSYFQEIDDGNKYYFSHPGAGIGAGGCSDYMTENSRDYYSYFTGSINLNGGTIDAYLGDNSDELSNAVIGGVDLGDTAKITVKGGCTVRVHQSGSKIAGRALLKAKEVKLEDADGYSSRVSNLTNPSEVALTNERVAWCQRENSSLELLIEPCTHENGTYVDKGDVHSVSCSHCARNSDSEAHAYGEPVWAWGEDHLSATATFTCGVCEHVETVEADIEARPTGVRVETTAKVTIGGKVYMATMYTYEVTFKVENGSWDGGDADAADKVVTLFVPAGTMAKLAAEQIPAVGAKPAAGYTAGAWEDGEPSADAEITENTTYTYRYAGKGSIAPSVTIEGWAYGEEPNGPVLGEGSNPGGGAVTFEYKAKGADDGAYSTDVPTEPGDYTVRASVAETANYPAVEVTADFTIGDHVVVTAASVLSASVTLSGELVMNYYLNVPDELVAAGATAVLTGPEDGRTLPAGGVRVELSSLKKDDKGRYKVSYPVTAIRAHEPITLGLVDGKGSPLALHDSKGERLAGDELVYGLYGYFAEAATSQELGEAWKAKIGAIHTYCAYAAKWKDGTELPAGINELLGEETVKAGCAEHRATQTGTAPEGLKVTGATLLLDSKTSLRLYFTCDGDVSAHAVKLDGKTVTPKHRSGNKHYVEVSGIGVASLENRHAVTFDDAYTVELDALSYVHAVLAGGGQPDALKELVRAFYAYDRAFNQGA